MNEGEQEKNTHYDSLNEDPGINRWMYMNQEVGDEGREEEQIMDRVEEEIKHIIMGWESKTESERNLNFNDDDGDYGDDGSLADDEDDEDDDDDDDIHPNDDDDWRMLGKSFSFSPQVTIVRTTAEKQNPHGVTNCNDVRTSKNVNDVTVCLEEMKKNGLASSKTRCGLCHDDVLISGVAVLAGALLFPLMVWGGYELLPFETPMVGNAPYRLVYTLRCSLFASLPIVLGVLVYGVSQVRFGFLTTPMFEAKREDAIHMSFVRDSLRLFLIFFVQLSVTSTYIKQEVLRVVPLLTIVFCFGRLIYWVALYYRSSVRAFGFSLSLLPVLVLLGFNLMYICSSIDEGAVFHIAPPTTAPPPKARWWG